MNEVFIGTIMSFGFNFAPRYWAFCDGATMSISQNTALFSLLGTTYGGNGQTTFALPDLRGRSAIGCSSGGYDGNLGEVNELKLSAGDAATISTLAVNYCIATQGIFPSRG